MVIAQGAPVAQAKRVDFDREIRPILSDTCFTCHGPDEGSRQAGLRMDMKEGKESPFTERDGYRIIVPGKSSESRLYQKISSKDEQSRMPPVWSGRKLKAQRIELIREWIDQGAKWETHWAFVPPKRSPVPARLKEWAYAGFAIDLASAPDPSADGLFRS